MTKFNELRNEFLKNPNLSVKEREVIKDPILDTGEAIMQANWLIIEEKNVGQEKIPNLFDEELKNIQNPQPNIVLEKVIRVLNKHEVYLNNLINYAKEKKARKQKNTFTFNKAGSQHPAATKPKSSNPPKSVFPLVLVAVASISLLAFVVCLLWKRKRTRKKNF